MTIAPHVSLDLDPAQVTHRLYTTLDLHRMGMTKRQIRDAVIGGTLLRARRGAYLVPGVPLAVAEAASDGGRLACISALAEWGVFVLAATRLHVHLDRAAHKESAGRRNTWHWGALIRTPHPRATTVHPIDAVAQAVACQSARAAIATLDSALHLGLIDEGDLDAIFDRLPARRRVLRGFIDGRSEAGSETLVRLMALSLGFRVDVQVVVPGVGRVDLVLDGWLVVECDSEQFHSGWASQKRDRRRDLALAVLGMTSIRPIAEDVFHHPEVIIAALIGLREARPAAQRASRRSAAR
ncbi:hypothetical protein [Microbacterium sp. P03]|uniref:hypothetical protein n=1 Tax=Microbacterium sp. P03 TaxID=3366946 RepID=UPI003745E4C2